MALPLVSAKGTGLIRPDATEDEWAEICYRTREDVVDSLRALLEEEIKAPDETRTFPGAWQNANRCLGSKCRNDQQHLAAMLWLMGHSTEELADEAMNQFDFYGKGILMLASELVGFHYINPPHAPGEIPDHGDSGWWPEVPGQDGSDPKTPILDRNQALKVIEGRQRERT